MNNKDIFNSTGFDLINGYRRTKEHPNEINDGHVNFVNIQIYPKKNNSNRILQRLIGDDKIYLDNYSIKYPISLTINDSIFIGKHNPNLVYNIRNFSSKNELDNFMSRSEPITINSNASLSINYSKGFELNTANCNNCIINNTIYETSTTIPFCSNLLRINNVEEEMSSIINDLEYKLYPNPTESSINLELINSIYTDYTIVNHFGQILSQKRIDSPLNQIDLSNFSEGVYLLILKGKEKVSSSKFIVIK